MNSSGSPVRYKSLAGNFQQTLNRFQINNVKKGGDSVEDATE